MNILFLNQFFWPDSSATSQLLTDLCRGLADAGHRVTVICADSGYAPSTSDQKPNVRIARVSAVPFVRGKAGRMLSYLSFYLGAMIKSIFVGRPDVVISLTTPPLISLVGSMVKLFRGSRHIIWEMDVYPDIAVDLNYFTPGGIIHRLTGLFADASRRHADSIVVLGKCMKQRLIARNIDPTKLLIAENWADGDAIRPQLRTNTTNKLVLLYSGNLGLAHDLDTIVGSIRELKDDDRFQFVFVGGGARRKELASVCRSEALSSVTLLPYTSREGLGFSLSQGDVGLVTQQDTCCGSVVPSKVYGILAAGRPILYVGPKESTVALTIERFQCGWQVDCGDVTALSKLLLTLAADRFLIIEAGYRARKALLSHFNRPIGVQRIIDIVTDQLSPATLARCKPVVTNQ